ncbi:MAG: imidazoleglycerol-phosphate dehydratase HisB [Deltaproteobacteria bacterium]|nr:imidazoleglycerol-phosphate dehydratase HisB [Deltaproteobacteria bacterium]
MIRSGKVVRKTTETDVVLEIVLNCSDASSITTTMPFLDHMLNLLAKHGAISLTITASGDTEIDEHHLVEDIGISLGLALKEALGNKAGISRYGFSLTPMDEALCAVALDISGRSYLVFNVKLANRRKLGSFDPALVKEFFKAFSDNSGVTLHINLEYGSNTHHIVEVIFKAFALALKMATREVDDKANIPSTKGLIG